MAQSSSKKRTRCLEEIERLRGRRRLSIIKCSAALATIIVVLAGKQILAAQGIIDPNGVVAGALTMLIAFGLAIVGGTASIEFTKSGSKIRELKNSCGITKDEIRNHRA